MMCGDPGSKVAPHSEDYSEPYQFEPPFEYAVCTRCHARIHRRFAAPSAWFAYKMHLRRGGYGADLKIPVTARELANLAAAIEADKPFDLPPMPRVKSRTGSEWWEKLALDPQTLTDPAARPRP